MSAHLLELAREVLQPVLAPASFVDSRIIGPELDDAPDADEWVALDPAVARRIAEGGGKILLRASGEALFEAPRLGGLALEAVVTGPDALGLGAIFAALDRGVAIRAVLATGETGIDAYRAAAAARHALGTRLAIRVRWDDVLDVKGAALALTFGADELAGPLAPSGERWKLAQVGGPPEDVRRPSPILVESLIRAAGRQPARRPK